jgi:glucose/mannose-6-phosphate isomerase
VLVHRDYALPPSVDNETLVIAASYSGMTEETLASFEAALATPAPKLVITTGGRLQALAQAGGVPAFVFDYESAPRAALGYGLFALLGILHKIGFLSGLAPQVEEAITLLDELASELGETVPQKDNPAKKLAVALYRKLAVIYGAGITSAVARRWKTQINENGKAWAFFELFPELNHNSVVGYGFPQELALGLYVILLRSGDLHRRILRRYEVTSELLDRAGIQHQILDARGQSPLAQMMSLVLMGDYVSYYLALLYEADPTPTKAIDYLKRKLGEP